MSKSLTAWSTPWPSPRNACGEPGQLARVDLGGRRRRAARGAVVVAAAGREPGRAGLERVARSSARICGDVVVGRDLAGDRALAHHVHAQRVVRDLDEEVDRVRHRARSRPCSRRTTPSPTGCPRRAPRPGCPRRPPSARRAPASRPRPHRREPDAAAAHHAGRHAVQRARRQLGDPTTPGRRSGCGCRRSRAARARPRASIVRRAGPAQLPTSTIRPSCTATSPRVRRAAGAVDERAAGDLEIEHGVIFYTVK